MITIMGEKWICTRCGKYFYINEGAGAIINPRCPFCWSERGVGKFIQMVRITM